MVGKLRLAVISAVTLLALGACQALFIGVFPGTAAQATVQYDLSAVVPSIDASEFDVSVVQGFGHEFVVLHTSTPFDPSLPHVLVFNPKLELRDTYTLDFLVNDSTVPPVGYPVEGNIALTDASDRIIIGNVQYFPQLNDLVPMGKLISGAPPPVLSGPSITGVPFSPQAGVNYWVDPSNTMYWTSWDPAWMASSSPWALVRQPAQGQVWLRGAFADPGDLDNDQAFLVFGESGSQTTWFMRVPKSKLAAGGLTQPLFDVPAYTRFSKDNLDSRLFFYTRQGLIAYDESSRSLVRFLFDRPDKVDAMRAPQLQNQRLSFSLSGNYFVAWDPASRILTRYEQWW